MARDEPPLAPEPVAPPLDPQDATPAAASSAPDPPGTGATPEELPPSFLPDGIEGGLTCLLADELLAVRADERLRRWWKWHVPPNDRLRLDREYADLCPDGTCPYDWYLVRPLRGARWWRRLPALLPAVVAGPATLAVLEASTGRPAPLFAALLAGLLMGRLMEAGDFLTRVAAARRAGLIQAMLLAGRPAREIGGEFFLAARLWALHFPIAATLPAGVLLQALHGLRLFDYVALVVLLFVQVGRLGSVAAPAGRLLDTREEPGELAARRGQLLLGFAISRFVGHQPRWLLGAILPAALLATAGVFIAALVLLAGLLETILGWSGVPAGDPLVLIAASVGAGLVALEVAGRLARRLLPLDAAGGDLGEWP